jgi:hypothetical protein
MNLNDLHRRLLRDVLEIGNAFPRVIIGWRVEIIGVDAAVCRACFPAMRKT